MSVFRRRRVFRDSTETKVFSGATIVTASVAAAFSFATTATGSTPGLTGTATAAVVVSLDSISSINIEISASYPIVAAVNATGVQRSPGIVSTPVVFGLTPASIVGVTAAVEFTASATVGSTFTMDVSAPVVFTVSPVIQTGAVVAADAVVGFAIGIPEITDGTISTAASPAVAWGLTGTAVFGETNNVPVQFHFATVFNAAINTRYTSNAEVITGMTIPAEISVDEGEYSINGAPFVVTSGFISSGDSVRVRQTSSDEYATPTIADLTIGGVTASFVLVTQTRPVVRAPRRNRVCAPKRKRGL